MSLSFSGYDDVWQAENETIKTNEENNLHNFIMCYWLHICVKVLWMLIRSQTSVPVFHGCDGQTKHCIVF